MESDLTKTIKKLTHYYHPKLNAKMRTIRWADEVWTPSGIVDSIRFEDYNASEEYLCRNIDTERFDADDRAFDNHSIHPLGVCFRDGSVNKDASKCRGCIYRSHVYEIGMMITCFEVKITYSDFKSKHGHNFHGNENYYCAPMDLAKKIAAEVPDGVGVLGYFSSQKICGLRKVKEAIWHNVDPEIKCELLYNAMKKWCDGAVFV